ncbi:hypothetical protein DK867_23030 [Ochrobactrum sp. POC9]|uniref:hypothetical protein n=1 Tax=Brucella/Ochrobactrum group TaxID=2826938 RepID=UPI000D706019|nr:hypothetical protein [Ochrobactrum sp. POC9]PWU70747.1 hypothetical protein DK867_23030 [Ochrobactrum sp. POC9]
MKKLVLSAAVALVALSATACTSTANVNRADFASGGHEVSRDAAHSGQSGGEGGSSRAGDAR